MCTTSSFNTNFFSYQQDMCVLPRVVLLYSHLLAKIQECLSRLRIREQYFQSSP
ncbi:hypothetical protein ACRRTK_002301 [Alexandromys fortis]